MPAIALAVLVVLTIVGIFGGHLTMMYAVLKDNDNLKTAALPLYFIGVTSLLAGLVGGILNIAEFLNRVG